MHVTHLLTIAAALGALASCRKKAEPGRFEDFIAPVGQIVPAACTAEADGRRFTLTGFASLPDTLSVEGDDSAVEFAEQPGGRALSLAVKIPADVRVQAVGAARIAPGFRATRRELDPASFRVVTADGEATASERVTVTVQLEVAKHFQTHQVTGCTMRFVSAVKAR